MKHNIYIYILVMAGVTYLIRMLPLVLLKKKITSRYIKSFLYYVPYACLAAMTFPAILHSTANIYSALEERVCLLLRCLHVRLCLLSKEFYSKNQYT